MLPSRLAVPGPAGTGAVRAVLASAIAASDAVIDAARNWRRLMARAPRSDGRE
ncbi:MAG: hypothetical protein ACOY4O_05840 [Pseudomonadota bacterium]